MAIEQKHNFLMDQLVIFLYHISTLYICCRYGPKWAQWREISPNDSLREFAWLEADLSSGVGLPRSELDDGTEATLDLGLNANLKITSLIGHSSNDTGDTFMLQAKLSNGASWGSHGNEKPSEETSARPSPFSPPLVLSHLSGDETSGARILRFHWSLNASAPSICITGHLMTLMSTEK